MSNIKVLDCTLRDGGYCNNWLFGVENIKKILIGLERANVDIVECGFLSDRVVCDINKTKYSDVRQIDSVLPLDKKGTKLVIMMNYGEYDVEKLPLCSDTNIDGIRLAFHKKDKENALRVCRLIKEKGYLLFIQPMVSMNYSDEEFEELVRLADEIKPFAFYIVDSFGIMNKRSLAHFFDIADEGLTSTIYIGFHSHNNLQSAFSNAQSLVERETNRYIIIDCSIYGMGRGAGNLNLELFINELNQNMAACYQIKPILQIIDEILNRFYEERPWGYSLPNYLSAIHMIHPNYARYLSEKKTLAMENIDEIFSMIDDEKKYVYDEKYIDDLYIKYMSKGTIRDEHMVEIRKKVSGRHLLLIAPGRSVLIEQKKIRDFIHENNPIVISINHECPICISDYIFVSNIRRFKTLDSSVYSKTISTSNIKSFDTYASADYYSLLNDIDSVRDNAGMMAIKFAMNELNLKQVFLAGFDGYSHDVYENFETKDMALISPIEALDKMNEGMSKVLLEYSKRIKIDFITSSILI